MGARGIWAWRCTTPKKCLPPAPHTSNPPSASSHGPRGPGASVRSRQCRSVHLVGAVAKPARAQYRLAVGLHARLTHRRGARHRLRGRGGRRHERPCAGGDDHGRLTTALQRDCALQVQACLAHNLYAIAGDPALHRSTASTELLRAQRVLTQSPGPIWRECAVYRAGSRILSDADGWGKKSAYVIHVALAGSGHNRPADPGVEFGESRDVGRERSHLLSVFHHDQVVARLHDLRRLEAEGRQEFDWRSEEHTSELQSPCNLVCRLLLEKKKKKD